MRKYTVEEQMANRAKLVEALCSGKYEQVRAALAENPETDAAAPDCFCVMGLACELSGLGKWVPTGSDDFFYLLGGKKYRADPPDEIREFYGIPSHYEMTLIKANDEGATFEELAIMIKSLPPPSDDEQEA